jgi:hypothetical protein
LPLAGPLGKTTAPPYSLAAVELSPSESPDAPATRELNLQASTPMTVSLPLVQREYFSPLPCSPASPFGIEIAALHEVGGLHQVQPPTREAQSVDALAEAQWLERVEAGFATLVDALESSGACWTRVQVNWAMIQPNPPPAPYVWGPYHDDLLKLVAESGVQIIAVVHDVPDWAQDPQGSGEQRVSAARMGDFAQFLTDAVNRYKVSPYNIRHWELFNEPDGTVSWPGIGGWGDQGADYARMLSWAYPAIKAADPGATVLLGGLAYDWFTEYKGPFNRYFADAVMAAGGGDFLDVTNLHYFPDFYAEWERWVPHGNPPTCGDVEDLQDKPYTAWGIDLVAKTNHFRNRLSTCFGVSKPVWVTELAEHGESDQPEALAQQARYVVQGQVRALAAGVEKIIWFALVSPSYDPWDQGLLFDHDWSPKPAFYTYRTLILEMTGYTYARSLDTPDVEGYVFRNAAGQEKTVAWAWGDPGQPAFLTFASTHQLRVVNREGQMLYVQDGSSADEDGLQNGSVTLRLPAPPFNSDPENPAVRYTAEPLFISKE